MWSKWIFNKLFTISHAVNSIFNYSCVLIPKAVPNLDLPAGFEALDELPTWVPNWPNPKLGRCIHSQPPVGFYQNLYAQKQNQPWSITNLFSVYERKRLKLQKSNVKKCRIPWVDYKQAFVSHFQRLFILFKERKKSFMQNVYKELLISKYWIPFVDRIRKNKIG